MVLLLALALLACAPGEPAGPPAPVGAATITPDALRATVEELASDAYLGRDTLGPGGDRAADYLVARLEALGVKPLPGHDYRVPYTLHAFGPDPSDVELTWLGDDPVSVEPGAEARPFPFSGVGALEAPVVFAGYGITAPDVGWDDYAGLDVAGKIVLLLRHHPLEGSDDGPFGAATDHAAFTAKAGNARKHGAVGMLVVTDPKHHPEADDLRMTPWLSIDPPPEEPEPADGAAGGAAAEAEAAPFLALQVSREAVAALLPADRSLLAVQDALDGGARPVDLGLPARSARLRIAEGEHRTYLDHNVVAVIPGTSDELVVVGAHYDHVGAFAGDGDTVFNGADDNASGTAGVLALAEALSTLPPPERTVVFAFFSGEEKGLLGSRAFVRDRIVDPARAAFVLNLDMIGRNPDEPVQLMGDGFGTGVAELATAAAGDLPVALQGDRYAGNSDHDPFYRADVPFLHVFTGLHDDYHQLSDHADKVDYERMAAIVRVGLGIVEPIARGEVTPAFVHHLAWLGVTVRVEGGAPTVVSVTDDSRASRAGIAVGDVVVAFDDAPLETPESVGAAFRAIEPGTTFRLGLSRDGAPVEVPIERAPTGFLGVGPGEPSDEVRARFGLGAGEGVLLVRVLEDGPAAEAGLQDGDVVYRLGGYSVGLGNLGGHLARIGAGEPIEVELIRGEERLTRTLVLGERPRR